MLLEQCGCVWSYCASTGREGSVGKVGTAEVAEVWDHEEGIADIGSGLEEASLLLPPQHWKTGSQSNCATLKRRCKLFEQRISPEAPKTWFILMNVLIYRFLHNVNKRLKSPRKCAYFYMP